MFALLPVIKTRLASLDALDGWAIRTQTEVADRGAYPAIEISLAGAGFTDTRQDACSVEPLISVAMLVEQGADATALESAFAAVIGSLAGHSLGTVAGRRWAPLKPERLQSPEVLFDDALTYDIQFSTHATYQAE